MHINNKQTNNQSSNQSIKQTKQNKQVNISIIYHTSTYSLVFIAKQCSNRVQKQKIDERRPPVPGSGGHFGPMKLTFYKGHEWQLAMRKSVPGERTSSTKKSPLIVGVFCFAWALLCSFITFSGHLDLAGSPQLQSLRSPTHRPNLPISAQAPAGRRLWLAAMGHNPRSQVFHNFFITSS